MRRPCVFQRNLGAGDGIRTRNPQLGNLIPWSLSINTLAFFLRFSPLHTLQSLHFHAPFARSFGTFLGQEPGLNP